MIGQLDAEKIPEILRQPRADAQQRMRLGASEFVTSPQSDLTADDAPRLALLIREGAKDR